MAKVDCQLLVTSVDNKTDRQFFDTKEGAIVEVMHECSHKTQSDMSITKKDTEDHDVLYLQCYSWLTTVRQSNVKCKSYRLCAQARQHTWESELKRLMEVQDST